MPRDPRMPSFWEIRRQRKIAKQVYRKHYLGKKPSSARKYVLLVAALGLLVGILLIVL